MIKKAFSLLELILVVVIMATMSVMGWYMLSSYDEQLVRLEVHRMEMALKNMLHKAVATQSEQELHINIQAHSYMHAGTERKLIPGVEWGSQEGALGPPSSPVQPLTSASTFAENCIRAFPDGTLSSGTLYLTTKKHTATYAISCEVGTLSYIRCYKYHRKRWILLS